MIFNFKKIASVLASAVMLTSTIGFAAAANYPAPFTSGGAVVYGVNAAQSDLIAAIDVFSNLKDQTSSVSVTASASGGDNVNLATSSQRLYYNSTLNAAKTSITKSEMSTLLVDGTVSDDAGTSYTYTQTIKVGDRQIAYSTSGNDFDNPELIIDAGYTATTPIYNYTVTFNKNINITHTDVQGNDIEILGRKFTIGASSTSAASTPLLYLYGAGDSVTLNEGEESTITVGGEEHTVTVSGITQSGTTDKVSVSVDGSTIREVNEGSSSKIGGLEVYAKTVFYSAKEASTNYATLNIGTEKLKLQHGQNVFKGSDETSIQNTQASLTTSGGLLSGFSIFTAMQDTTADYIKTGGSFVDPVLGGMKISFASVTPTLEDSARDYVLVDTDNSRNARVTFTSAIVNEEKIFTFSHDSDTSDSTVTPILSDTANKTIHVIEGEDVLVNEYMVINSGDYGRIVRLTSIPTGALQSTSTIQFIDALTGNNIFSGGGLTVGATGNATTNIDGQPYYFSVTNRSSGSSVNVTWGAGANYMSAGTQTVLYPRIKLKSGSWIAIMKPVTINSGTTYSLPGSETLTTYETGNALTMNTTVVDKQSTFDHGWKIGNVNYTLDLAVTNVTATVWGIDANNNGGAPECSFNATWGGAILFLEEKKTTESGNSDNGDAICIAADVSGSTTPVEISIATPQVTNVFSGLQSWTSDSYQQSGVTRYGTFVKYNSQDNDKVELYYPNEQMFVDILFASDEATITPGSAGGATGTVAIVKDTEVSSVKDKNLFIVGGSCINTVAAKILDSDSPLCGADFTEKTNVGGGQYIIKTVTSPYNEDKIAMLVAGYEAAETKLAVKTALEGVSTGIGEKIYPTASSAE